MELGDDGARNKLDEVLGIMDSVHLFTKENWDEPVFYRKLFSCGLFKCDFYRKD